MIGRFRALTPANQRCAVCTLVRAMKLREIWMGMFEKTESGAYLELGAHWKTMTSFCMKLPCIDTREVHSVPWRNCHLWITTLSFEHVHIERRSSWSQPELCTSVRSICAQQVSMMFYLEQPCSLGDFCFHARLQYRTNLSRCSRRSRIVELLKACCADSESEGC